MKYYQVGGLRIALRVNGVVRWLATDHLGSTAVTADGVSGGRTAELWYKPLRQAQGRPWGESRGIPFGATPTQRRFTGQTLDNVAGGLYFYNARYYDPTLARFTQADTIVPQPGDPQSLNRYSYVGNKPLRYTDPSGHAAVCGTSTDGGCGEIDALHNIEMQLRRGRLDAIGAKQAYYQYYLTHPGENVGAYQPLNPTEEFNGIISTGYAQAQAELGAGNLGGLALGAATTNGVIFEAMSGYGGNAAHGIGVVLAGISTTRLFRSASGTPDSLTPRPGHDDTPGGGLSFFDNVENPGVKPGKVVEIDPNQLRNLQVKMDDDPPGHVLVRPGSDLQLQHWAATRGTGVIHSFTQEILDAIVGIFKK